MNRFVRLPVTWVTLSSLLLGLTSIVASLNGATSLSRAGWVLMLAGCYDALDGALARAWKQTSDEGAELDNLCDMVVFGVAPATLLWGAGLHRAGAIGALVAFVYVASTAIRLSRYSVMKRALRGIPCTMAGGTIAAFVAWWPTANLPALITVAIVGATVQHMPLVARRFSALKHSIAVQATCLFASVGAISLGITQGPAASVLVMGLSYLSFAMVDSLHAAREARVSSR